MLGETSGASANTYETSNLLNFANVGTEEISILVFKPESMPGFEVTAETWYNGKENIPYGWIRPYDNISDYFLQVVCVKGNWTNYPVLSTDPIWKGYFDKKGIRKDRINTFLSAEGINVLGSWSGSIIPDFTDKQGNSISLEKKINAATERTGLLMSFNQDLANVLIYDYNGIYGTPTDPDTGDWALDIDGDGEGNENSNKAEFIVDMVGHEAFKPKAKSEKEWSNTDFSITGSDISTGSYVYAPNRNRFYTPVEDIKELVISNDEKNVSIYADSSTSSQVLKAVHPGKFVAAHMVDTTYSINVQYSVINIENLFKGRYYTITDSGTLLNAKSLYPEFKMAEHDASGNIDYVDVSAFFALDNSTFCQEYKVRVQDSSIIGADEGCLRVLLSDEQVEPINGINFLSYNYIETSGDKVSETVKNVNYFSDPTLWEGEMPVTADTKNMFIITDVSSWQDANIKLGDYVHNITYNNEPGETEEYKLIPGLTKVIRKQFVTVDKNRVITYQGKEYKYNGEFDYADPVNLTKEGFYVVTCTAPVLIEQEDGENIVTRQLPISDNKISESLRFIPMKGLNITSRHRPGYDASGNLNIEDGIEKVYKVLDDEGIKRGLMNPTMVDYRYIIDSMSYGLGAELGGKVWLSKTAKKRGKCTAILNLPSAKQFAVCSNPYFCDTYIPGTEARPTMDTKYIPLGGNTEMGSTVVFSLPSEEDGAKFTACFWPHLIYKENGKDIIVPPAADVANVLNNKFTGAGNPYTICANQDGILSSRYLSDVEFPADLEDRKSLEPFGVNTIIKEQGSIMIYGNQTAYQAMKSDFNKLHIRENLNTAEIECEKVLKKFNFKYNTPTVRATIVQQLSPILQAMQISGALSRYEIICDESNNTQEVIEADTCIVEVNLWMNHGMEKIVQVFTLQRLSDQ